jgi:fatty-acyl-CoA synthase
MLFTHDGFRNAAAMTHFWQVVERYRVTFFSAVPAVISALLTVDSTEQDISSPRAALCGTATLPQEVKRQFEVKTGLTIVEGYGQTEGTCVSTVNPLYGEHRSGSVGLPLPYLQVRVVVVDDQGRALRDCRVNEVGCIAIKGPNIIAGYKQADKNNDLWVEAGWLNTGDLGRLDKDGYLWLTGRSKDLIIRGGHNIDPVLIEEVLHRHPAVAAAAVGKPDAKAGELPVAYVQLAACGDASAEDILAFASEHIGERAAVPKHIYFVDNLPLTAVGKVFKTDLRRDVIARTCREVLAAMALTGDVVVDTCDQLGQVARITLSTDSCAASDALSAKLAHYQFHHQIEVSTRA